MELWGIKQETIFLIATFSELKWILNEKSQKLLGLEVDQNLIEFHLGTCTLDETWTRDFCLHLNGHSTHEEEFEISNQDFLTYSQRF